MFSLLGRGLSEIKTGPSGLEEHRGTLQIWVLREGTLTLAHSYLCLSLCQDDLVAQGVAERTDERSSLWVGRASLLGLELSPFGPAFAFPVCRAPQGQGISAEARAEEQTCKLLPICLLSEGLRLGRDSIVLMDSEHQGLPRKDKSLTGREAPPNHSLEMSPLSQGSLTNVTSNSHGPYMDTTPSHISRSAYLLHLAGMVLALRIIGQGETEVVRNNTGHPSSRATVNGTVGPSPVRDEDGEVVVHASTCSRQPGSQCTGRLGWPEQAKGPHGLVPDPSTIRPSLYFLSWLLGQAGLLEPFLKRNQAVVAQTIFSQLC